MITPADINLTPVIEASVKGVLEDQGALDSFAWEDIDPALKEVLARNITPYLRQALPAILGQVNARLELAGTGTTGFVIPDTLEGLA